MKTGLGVLLFIALTGCLNSERSINQVSPDKQNVDSSFGPYVAEGLDRDGLTSLEVRQAMSRVPRHLFVPEEQKPQAYADRALAIGSGQTISQPYIVALMTEKAGIEKGMKVLEIGTGSGYQAAVLAELGATVYSVEIVPELAKQAEQTLRELGYSKVHVRVGDGWLGWPEEAPFDAILVTAASPKMPEKLLEQLAPSGRMVLPLEGDKPNRERLMLVQKDGDNFRTRDLGAVRFVPLVGTARGESLPSGTVNILDRLKGRPATPMRVTEEAETEEDLDLDE